jgi:hypothetical protein
LIPYVLDYKKWERHFADVYERRVRPDHKVAQTLEMAKSELARGKERK